MENPLSKPDLLNLQINLQATPAFSFQKTTVVNAIADEPTNDNFSVVLDTNLDYNELSLLINQYVKDKKFDIIDGLMYKYITIQQVELYGVEGNIIKMDITFGGSFTGKIIITGHPYYDAANKVIVMQNVSYNLDTNDFLLKTVKWLFNNKIMGLLQKYTTQQLGLYYITATQKLNEFLNKEWSKGIRSVGSVSTIAVTGLTALPQNLEIKALCSGYISLLVMNQSRNGSK